MAKNKLHMNDKWLARKSRRSSYLCESPNNCRPFKDLTIYVYWKNTVSGLWSTGQGAGVAKTFVNHPKPPTFYYLYLNSKSQELSPLSRMWRSANQVKKREEIGINDNPIILC